MTIIYDAIITWIGIPTNEVQQNLAYFTACGIFVLIIYALFKISHYLMKV